jgi:hypothetical protein
MSEWAIRKRLSENLRNNEEAEDSESMHVRYDICCYRRRTAVTREDDGYDGPKCHCYPSSNTQLVQSSEWKKGELTENIKIVNDTFSPVNI